MIFKKKQLPHTHTDPANRTQGGECAEYPAEAAADGNEAVRPGDAGAPDAAVTGTPSDDWDNDTWHTEDPWENDPWKSHTNPGDPYAPDPEPPEPEPYAFPIETTQGLVRAVPLLASILCLLAGVLCSILMTVFQSDMRYIEILRPLFLLILIAGIVLLPVGIVTVRGYFRFFKYLEVIDRRLVVPVDELVIPEIKTREKLIRDLRRLIFSGYFLEGHLDEEAGLLYLTDEAYEESRAAETES